jgi:hypothetical protein
VIIPIHSSSRSSSQQVESEEALLDAVGRDAALFEVLLDGR